MDIISFREDMLDDAAHLLAQRHRRNRGRSPLLPEEFEDDSATRRALQSIWNRRGASGAAAILGGRLVGFLIGHPSADPLRNRHVWMHTAGHALHETVDAEVYRDLYAVLGEQWVRNGFFDHFILTSANTWDDLTAWLQLGFACEQVHALLDIDGVELPPSEAKQEILIRQAQADDRGIVQSFYDIIPKTTAGAPVWGVALPELMPEIEDGYGELLDEEGTTLFLAFLKGEAVGLHVYRTLDTDTDLLVPKNTIRLTVGSTKEHARGLGVTTALFRHGVAYAKQKGFRYFETDWRIANLFASRTWPKLGFEPVAYRMVRKVDSRITWATGHNRMRL